MRRMKQRRSTERGAAMAELAIVIPVLVMVLFAIVQMGIALNRVQAYEAAAREGARVGSVGGTNSDINDAVTTAVAGISGPAPSVGVSPGTCPGRAGDPITVSVSAPYTVQIPLLPDQSFTLSGNGVFRCEG